MFIPAFESMKLKLFRTPYDAGILVLGDKGTGRSQLSNVLSGNSFEPQTLYSLPQWYELFKFEPPSEHFPNYVIMIAPYHDSDINETILKNVQMVMLLASYDNLDSFNNLQNKWIPLLKEIKIYFQPTAKFCILLTKSDLIGTEQQKITNDMVSS